MLAILFDLSFHRLLCICIGEYLIPHLYLQSNAMVSFDVPYPRTLCPRRMLLCCSCFPFFILLHFEFVHSKKNFISIRVQDIVFAIMRDLTMRKGQNRFFRFSALTLLLYCDAITSRNPFAFGEQSESQSKIEKTSEKIKARNDGTELHHTLFLFVLSRLNTSLNHWMIDPPFLSDAW